MELRRLDAPDGWLLATIPYNRGMHCVNVSATILRPGLALIGMVWLFGCQSSGTSRDQITSPYPLDRARAAVACAEAGDAEAVDLLIELLDDHDRGVRMYTILALERLCGEDYGYRYYHPDPERAAAIARWRQARQHGEVTVQTSSPQTDGQSATTASASDGSEEATP